MYFTYLLHSALTITPEGTVVIPILPMGKLRHIEGKSFAQGHTARKEQSYNSHPESLAPESQIFDTGPHCFPVKGREQKERMISV